MQLLELELVNIKSYTQAVITFTEGINGIVGANGAGKSTILEAIGCVLFNNRDPRPSSLLRQGQRTGWMRVRLLHQEHTYDVVRYVGRNLSYVHNCDDDARLCEGQHDVQAFLQLALGMADNTAISLDALFQHAIGVPQGSFQSPFLARAGVRKAHFGPLLNVDKYQEAYKHLRETERHIAELVQEKALEQARLTAQLAPRETKACEHQEWEQTGALLSQQIRDDTDRLQIVTDRIAHWDQMAETLRQLQQDHNVQQQELAHLTGKLHLATANRDQSRESQRLVAEHKPAHDRYLAVEQAMSQIQQQLQDLTALQARTARLDAELTTRQERHQVLTRELAALQDLEQEAIQLQDAVTQHAAAERELERLGVTVSTLATVQEDLRHVQAECAQATAQREEIVTQLSQRARLEEQAECETRQAQQAARRWDELDRQRLLIQAHLDSLSEQQQALQKVATHKEHAHGTSGTAVCPVCQQTISAGKQRDLLAHNDQARQGAQQELTTLQDQLQSIQKSQNAFQDAAEHYRMTAATLRQDRDLYAVDAHLQNLQRELTRHETNQTEWQQACERQQHLEELKTRLQSDVNRHHAITARLVTGTALQSEKEELDSRLDHLAQELEVCRAQETDFSGLAERETELRIDLQTYRPAYECVISHTDRARNLNMHTRQWEDLTQQQSALQTTLAALSSQLTIQTEAYDADEHVRLRQDKDALQTALTRAETEHQHAMDNKNRLARELVELEAVAAQEAQAAQEHAVRQRRAEHLTFLRTLLQQVQPRITAALIDRISQEAAEFFSQLMDDATKQLHWTEDFGIQLRVAGQDRDFRQLSGGEQMTAALAVILALLRGLTNVQFAFFDEPTTNLDQERRTQLAERIGKIRGFRQLFIISHDDTFEANLNNVIHIRKEDDVSYQVMTSDA